MSYTPEHFNAVELPLNDGPYGIPLNPLALQLEFADGAYYPPLPWVLPGIVVSYTAPLQRAERAARSTRALLVAATAADDERAGRWGRATHAPNELELGHSNASNSDSRSRLPWGQATIAQTEHRSPWRPIIGAKDAHPSLHWEVATPKDSPRYSMPWDPKPGQADTHPAMAWYTVNLHGTPYDDSAAMATLRQSDTFDTISLAGFSGPYTPTAWSAQAFAFGYQRPPRPIVPDDVAYSLTARQAAMRDSWHRLPWGTGDTVWRNWNLPYPVEDNDEPEPPDPPGPAEPPEKRTVYLIMNTLQITDVDSGTPLDIVNVSISLDIDSLSWQFTGSLFGAGSLALVQPDAQGMKDIAVTINGHSWVFAIERYTSDERFPTKKWQIKGTSRTQYMAAPFAPTRTYTNPSQTSAAQAATQELALTGFSLTWPTSGDGTIPDWPLPAGALSYRDKAPAQVVADIVKAAGGVLIPHQASDGWTVQPRYKVPPWQWASATPDAEIYIGMVRTRSAQYEPGPEFNACYVSGINQGVAVDVRRQGSGGTAPMPDIYHDLITDTQPAISRGRQELAATGNKVVETLSLIIPENGAAPGILTPGQLVKISHDDPAEDYLGLVLSNTINAQQAGAAAIYQNVTIERAA